MASAGTADAVVGESGPSEQVVLRKWDRCISNLLVNTAIGSAVGIVTAFVFFKSTVCAGRERSV